MRDPQELSLLVEILDLSLEGLGALDGDLAEARKPVRDAVAGCLTSLRSWLQDENDPDCWLAADDARFRLRSILYGAKKTEEPAAETGGSLLEALNEVAGLLVRSQADDRASFGQARDIFLALAADGSAPEQIRESLAEAARLTAALAEGSSADPAAAFSGVSLLCDQMADLLGEEEISRHAKGQADSADAPSFGMDAPRVQSPAPMPVPAPSPALLTAPQKPAQAIPPPVPVPAAVECSKTLPPDFDASLMSEFVTECRDYIEAAEAALLALETDPEQLDAVNTVFRAFHTIKGTSGFLGIGLVTALAHKAENLLSRVRDKEIQCTGGYADLALRSIDILKLLIEEVNGALSGREMEKPEGYDALLQCLNDPEAAGISADPAQAACLEPRVGDLLVATRLADRDDVEEAGREQGDVPIGVTMVRKNMASVSDVAQALRAQKRLSTPPEAESSVRVRTDRLDGLIDIVGELVIAQSMVSQHEEVRSGRRQDLQRKVNHAGKIVRELQDLSMSMRMVPMKPTFQKMARMVRDLAHKGGKQIEFVTTGEDTEIDRNMVDVVRDPLVHMIRNACDHGVEPPEARAAAGKSPAGCVQLSAFNAGGSIVIEMSDDGQGLDRERIVRKAVERGLIDSDKGMADADVFSLIFEPGFSTAEKVTEVSGRGVGMDVVRRAIESLRGRVEIRSQKGKGTTFTVKLPLTLAITDGMLIQVGEQRFILPTVSIYMSFRPEASSLSTVTGRGEMVMLRGQLIPLFRLHRLFHLPGAVEDPTKALLVVVDDGHRRSALMVDELLGQQQVVAKSLGEGVGKIQGVSGGAILGDGRVGLILDPAGLAAVAKDGGVNLEASLPSQMMAA